MSFSLANQIRINTKAANLDIRYGPWLSEAAAKAGIIEGLREKGLTVGIYVPNDNTSSPVVEYWWKDGVTDNDLVLKTAGGGGTNLNTVTDYLSTNNVTMLSANITDTIVGTTARFTNLSAAFFSQAGTSISGTVSATGPFLIGNTQPLTGNGLVINGNVRVNGSDISMNQLSVLSALDTDGQSLFDLRSASPSASYNLSIASSGVGNFMKFFGGREGDERPFIVVKTGSPLRIASFSNFYNSASDFSEHVRINTAPGNVVRLKVFGSVEEGQSTNASGTNSHAEGGLTDAIGSHSHAEGYDTVATGTYSHTQNVQTSAVGYASHAEGSLTQASGFASHSEGNTTRASGTASHAEGFQTTASGLASHTEGVSTIASNEGSHAEGRQTTASGTFSHTEGFGTIASGSCSHAEGNGSIATNSQSHAEGSATIASGINSHAEGRVTVALGETSHAEGRATIAVADNSHAEGLLTTTAEKVPWLQYSLTPGVVVGSIFTFTASNSARFNYAVPGTRIPGAVTLGGGTGPIGFQIEVLNRDTQNGSITATTIPFATNAAITGPYYLCPISAGFQAHAQGYNTTAIGQASHAEGNTTLASGPESHAEGNNTIASGQASHAQGIGTTASGIGSHAEGALTRARGLYSHAAGVNVEAAHDRTWIWKGQTVSSMLSTTRANQFMVSADGGSCFGGTVGIGTDSQQNALTVVGVASATRLASLSSITAPGVNTPKMQLLIGDVNPPSRPSIINTTNGVDTIVRWNQLNYNTDVSILSADLSVNASLGQGNCNILIQQPGTYRAEVRYASYDLLNANNFLRLQLRASTGGVITTAAGGSLLTTLEQGYVGTTGNGEAMKSGVVTFKVPTAPYWLVATILHSGATGGGGNAGYPVFLNNFGTQPYFYIERISD